MIRRICMLALIATTLASSAQNKTEQERIKEVRQMYANAKEGMKEGHDESEDSPSLLENTLRIERNRVVGIVGPTKKIITCYSYQHPNMYSDTEMLFPLTFVTISEVDNILESLTEPTYHELLFDTNTGNLVFYFSKSHIMYEGDTEMIEEMRCYYNEDATVCNATVNVKQTDGSRVTDYEAQEYDAEKPIFIANDIKRLYNGLMNENYTYNQLHTTDMTVDLTFFELKGNVRSVSYDNEKENLVFDRNGVLVLEDGMDPFRVVGPSRKCLDDDCSQMEEMSVRLRDSRGNISQLMLLEYYEEYVTDASGRVLSSTSNSDDTTLGSTMHYDAQGRLVKVENYNLDEEGNKTSDEPTVTYTYLETDECGNWTKRRDNEGNIQQRTITYY